MAEQLNLNDLEHVSGGASAHNNERIYIVQEGDTLSEIALKHGTTTKKLALLNEDLLIRAAQRHGVDPQDPSEYMNYIYAGQKLRLP